MRDFFLRHRYIGLAIFVSILIFFFFGISVTKEGGILDDTILNKEDPYYKSDKYVRDRVGFEEFIPLIVTFPKGISKREDLEKIILWTEKAMELFGESVLSLSNFPNYLERDGRISDEHYISRDKLETLDIEAWKDSVRRDPAAYGILVERDFSWASVVIYLEPGYDEVGIFWDIAELVEEREIPEPVDFLKDFRISSLERLWKSDISPRDPNLKVGSWIIGRGTIYRTLPIEMYRLISIGLALTFILFLIILRSIFQAVFATALVGVSIAFAWGSVGIIDFLGIMPIRQRVYILAAFTNCIVQGVSFGLHKFEEFNRTGSWKGSQKVDMLIFNTTAVAFFGFMTLWFFELLSIRELGLVSGLGVIYLLILTTVFLPLVNLRPKKKGYSRIGSYYDAFIEFVAFVFTRLAMVSARKYLALLISIVSLAGGLILAGWLKVGSTPFDYIPGKHAEKTARYLNAPGRIGCDALGLLVEPRWVNEEGLYTERFVKSLHGFQNDVLANVKMARRVVSVVNSVNKMSLERYGRALPVNDAEAESVFFLLEEGISDDLIDHLWFDNGAKVTVFAPLNNSIEQAEFVNDVMKIAGNYKDLRVSPFGKVSLYNREDKYIREGKPKNVFGSQWVVIIFCFLIIVVKARRIRKSALSPWLGSVIMSTPFVFGSSVMALVMIVFRIPLDVPNAVITALAINAAIDFSVYYVDAYQEALLHVNREEAISVAMEMEGKIVINDIILNSACFLPLIFSSYIPIARLGWMMIVMIVSCGVGSLVIMPSFLKHAARKEGRDET